MARLSDLACPLIADRTGNVLMKWYSVLICYEVKLIPSLNSQEKQHFIRGGNIIFLFFLLTSYDQPKYNADFSLPVPATGL